MMKHPLGLENIQGLADFAALALPSLAGRFNSDPPPNTCGP
ncbi:MAG: hypothetical protein ACR2ND_01345 [Solirubrobacteraceae bacterium]